MIGRFGLGNKKSPSKEPGILSVSDVYDPQHVSQQVSPSQSSPNFFSLPLWKRRNAPLTPPSRPAFDDFGTPPPRSSSYDFLRNSSHPLHWAADDYRHSPPRLPNSGRSSGESHAGPSRLANERPSASSSSRRPVPPDPLLHSSQPTFTLARAALGLGLPHVMPGQVPSSPSPEINSVPFMSNSALSTPQSKSIMRRTRSFQKLTPQSVKPDMEYRRDRGLSLGPIHLGSEGKGKEREHDLTNGIVPPPPPPPLPQKVVSRKPSFWRRGNHSSKASIPDFSKALPPLPKASSDDDRSPRPSLPSLRPLSPFNVDTSSPIPQSLSAHLPLANSPSAIKQPAIQRRHSERFPPLTRTRSASRPLDDKPPSTRRRKASRPATADPTSSSRSSLAPSAQLLPRTPPTTTAPGHIERSGSLPYDPSKSRPRAQTNPPLLHRLSMNLFSTSASPVLASSLSPTPLTTSPAASSSSSPRPSTSKYSVEIPKPLIGEESPEDYVNRLMEAVNKADVASILAFSGDDFYAQALRVYISRFDFSNHALDVALRKLLMHVGLPRETQQIDRVIEAFAFRYSQCNPDLFTLHDHTYILAFSLIMLHTDAFNKSNKHKMTKADYIKNTSLPGIAPEVLDCFYHNIVFAPFIFIEDPVDIAKERGPTADGGLPRRMSTFGSSTGNLSGTTLLGKSAHIDPYYLITHNALGPLRVNVESFGSLDDPYSYGLPGDLLDIERIHNDFVNAASIEVSIDNHIVSPSFFSPMVGGPPVVMTPEFASGSTVWTIKAVKYGVLGRKDDTVEGGRRAINRKWKEWVVILTGSQLLLYRDSTWILNLLERLGAPNEVHSLVALPRPDELMPLKDVVAVRDKSYVKRGNVLRFVVRDGRQSLFQAPDETDMYAWIAHINYASAFKTASVRMRSGGLSREDIELTGRAAATSHLREMGQKSKLLLYPRVHSWNANSLANGHGGFSEVDPLTSWRQSGDTDLYDPASPRSEGSSIQFKATFDHVKADLAGGLRKSLDSETTTLPRAQSLDLPSIHSPDSVVHGEPLLGHSSRTRAIKQRILELDTKLSETRSQIDSDTRLVRNIAVLTPFQRATRDRLQAAFNNVAKRIMQARLEAGKLACHRDVLSNDLVAEENNWQQTKDVAINAAREVLQHQAMTLPDFEIISHPQILPIDAPESSSEVLPVDERFYSALDLKDSPAEVSPGLFASHRSQQFTQSSSNTPLTEAGSSVGSFPFHLDDGSAPSSTEQQDRHDGRHQSGHERFYTAQETQEERAEEWNKTKAAKRVSLVQVPTSLKMSLVLKPLRDPDEGTDSPSLSRSLLPSASQPSRILETVAVLDLYNPG